MTYNDGRVGDPGGQADNQEQRDGEHDGVIVPPEHIVCVDCGGRCGLLSRPPNDEEDRAVGFRPGDIVAYRCADCLDRWDIVLE